MKQARFDPREKRPDIEVNKPEEPHGPWRRPKVSAVVYLILLAGMWFLWNSGDRGARTEIPYSQFLEHLKQDEVVDAVVTGNLITGTLEISDEKTGAPQKFVTVLLANNDLAQLMEAHGVEYTVRRENNWLGTLLGWVLPFALLFLFWSWMGRRMSAASGFLNVGNRVRIHADTQPTVTFEDVAGVEEAKEELKESIEFLLEERRAVLDALAVRLQEKEVISGEELQAPLGKHQLPMVMS